MQLSNVGTFLVYFLGARRLPRLLNRVPFLEAILLISCGMILLLGFFLSSALGLLVAAAVLVGAGTTCCFICWEHVFSFGTVREGQQRIIAGSALSILAFAFLFVLGSDTTLFTVALLAFLNLVLLYASLVLERRCPAAPAAPDGIAEDFPSLSDPNPREAEGAFASLRVMVQRFGKPVLCIVMVGIISPVLGNVAYPEPLALEENCLLVLSANLLSACILGVIWFVLRKSTTVVRVYVILFPLLVTALLLLPFVADAFRIAIMFVGSFAFTLFSIVMMMWCITAARQWQMSLTEVYALFGGITYGSRLVGQCLASVISSSSLSQETQIFASVAILLYGCSLVMFVLARRGETRTGSAPAVASGVDVLHEACRQLSQEHGLSARQSEVLDLLVHGYDVPSAAKKLFISENTVRTHMKKIYALMDVHSKQEIIDAVNARCSSDAQGSQPPRESAG
ncbi:helix-turn-helix transcriptional regulator [Adlercreutzia sp. R21]|uniref:helix-turn-helix domain-containing protein n=1 Tax=Adlercreutzia wanghongyangiae TaxID=3111451 RepID=UPI002DB5D4C4|nr:helix-turn-helix transcriptional regulator [Adlercreutzia sp. R21]MEC4184277.1 helix-turn-helix transcriptional regulator [Adlercreutzia sp. R21]